MTGEDKPHELMAARKAAMKITWAAVRAENKRLLDAIEKRAAEGEEPNIVQDIIPQSRDSPTGGMLSPGTLPPTLTP